MENSTVPKCSVLYALVYKRHKEEFDDDDDDDDDDIKLSHSTKISAQFNNSVRTLLC